MKYAGKRLDADDENPEIQVDSSTKYRSRRLNSAEQETEAANEAKNKNETASLPAVGLQSSDTTNEDENIAAEIIDDEPPAIERGKTKAPSQQTSDDSNTATEQEDSLQDTTLVPDVLDNDATSTTSTTEESPLSSSTETQESSTETKEDDNITTEASLINEEKSAINASTETTSTEGPTEATTRRSFLRNKFTTTSTVSSTSTTTEENVETTTSTPSRRRVIVRGKYRPSKEGDLSSLLAADANKRVNSRTSTINGKNSSNSFSSSSSTTSTTTTTTTTTTPVPDASEVDDAADKVKKTFIASQRENKKLNSRTPLNGQHNRTSTKVESLGNGITRTRTTNVRTIDAGRKVVKQIHTKIVEEKPAEYEYVYDEVSQPLASTTTPRTVTRNRGSVKFQSNDLSSLLALDFASRGSRNRQSENKPTVTKTRRRLLKRPKETIEREEVEEYEYETDDEVKGDSLQTTTTTAKTIERRTRPTRIPTTPTTRTTTRASTTETNPEVTTRRIVHTFKRPTTSTTTTTTTTTTTEEPSTLSTSSSAIVEDTTEDQLAAARQRFESRLSARKSTSTTTTTSTTTETPPSTTLTDDLSALKQKYISALNRLQTNNDVEANESTTNTPSSNQDDLSLPIYHRRKYYQYVKDSPITYIDKSPAPPDIESVTVNIRQQIHDVFNVSENSEPTGSNSVDNQEETSSEMEQRLAMEQAREINSELGHFLLKTPGSISTVSISSTTAKPTTRRTYAGINRQRPQGTKEESLDDEELQAINETADGEEDKENVLVSTTPSSFRRRPFTPRGQLVINESENETTTKSTLRRTYTGISRKPALGTASNTEDEKLKAINETADDEKEKQNETTIKTTAKPVPRRTYVGLNRQRPLETVSNTATEEPLEDEELQAINENTDGEEDNENDLVTTTPAANKPRPFTRRVQPVKNESETETTAKSVPRRTYAGINRKPVLGTASNVTTEEPLEDKELQAINGSADGEEDKQKETSTKTTAKPAPRRTYIGLNRQRPLETTTDTTSTVETLKEEELHAVNESFDDKEIILATTTPSANRRRPFTSRSQLVKEESENTKTTTVKPTSRRPYAGINRKPALGTATEEPIEDEELQAINENTDDEEDNENALLTTTPSADRRKPFTSRNQQVENEDEIIKTTTAKPTPQEAAITTEEPLEDEELEAINEITDDDENADEESVIVTTTPSTSTAKPSPTSRRQLTIRRRLNTSSTTTRTTIPNGQEENESSTSTSTTASPTSRRQLLIRRRTTTVKPSPDNEIEITTTTESASRSQLLTRGRGRFNSSTNAEVTTRRSYANLSRTRNRFTASRPTTTTAPTPESTIESDFDAKTDAENRGAAAAREGLFATNRHRALLDDRDRTSILRRTTLAPVRLNTSTRRNLVALNRNLYKKVEDQEEYDEDDEEEEHNEEDEEQDEQEDDQEQEKPRIQTTSRLNQLLASRQQQKQRQLQTQVQKQTEENDIDIENGEGEEEGDGNGDDIEAEVDEDDEYSQNNTNTNTNINNINNNGRSSKQSKPTKQQQQQHKNC
ncbi:serine-rich adhesin for platelets-like [Drosophila tropicalis]|uniref:serine-rich adhesin for platelets-like n=1 Tax=Drosophila tropicalis TaxID=46794 RepID=UPI0035AC25C3